ncbi:MAG: GTP-binding protein, partial [Crocosphaera sp.]
QFQLSRKDEFLKAFVKDAITKVVQPLSDSWEEDEMGYQDDFRQPPLQQQAVLEEEEDDW